MSYQDQTTDDLKYARKSGGIWTIETVDGSANDVGYYTSIALDAQGNPRMSYQDQTTDDLKYARKLGGVWTTETADASANEVGLFTSLALDPLGNPHISYHDITTGDLKYAVGDVVTDVGRPSGAGRQLSVLPNPFVAETSVHYSIKKIEAACLTIFDVAGRRIRWYELNVTDGSIRWDGRDDSGREVAAGTYILRLTTGASRAVSERVTLIR
jgi:hypothetical protein